jgi:hypothetical protein
MKRGKAMLSMDVWPKLRELFNLPDISVSGEVVIRLDPKGLVKVDIGGVIPRHPREPEDITSIGDRIVEHA